MANISDKIASDLVDVQVQALRGAEGISQRLMTELAKAEDKILAMLNRADLTKFTRQRTVEALNQIRRIAGEFSGTAYKQMRNDASAVATAVAARTARDMNELFNLDLFNPTLSAQQLKRILDDRAILGGQTMQDFWRRQPALITDAYSQVIRTGLVTGASKSDMLREISESGRLANVRGSIRTLVRTSVMEVANTARTDMYADNLDLIKGLQWLSTLDTRTSPICRGLDGLSWSLPDYQPQGHDKRYPGATAHPGCRSTQIPVIRSFAELAKKNKALAAKLDDAMSAGTRASMNGQVANDLRYDDWLKAQGTDRALEILGPTRLAAWQSGQLELRDMVDQSGRPLTTDELQYTLHSPSYFPKEWHDDITLMVHENNDAFNKAFEAKKTYSKDFKAQLKLYTGPDAYTSMNSSLRAGVMGPTEEKFIKNIASLPKNDTELRLFRQVFDDPGHVVGDIAEMRGFTSTSINWRLGTFANEDLPIMYDIRVPKGATSLVAGLDREKEFILNNNTRFNIVGIREEEIDYLKGYGGTAGKRLTKIYEVEVVPEVEGQALGLKRLDPTEIEAQVGTAQNLFEEKIVHLDYEAVGIIDKVNGTVIAATSSGEPTAVSFTKQFAEQAKGRVLTHNHPNGVSFSLEDLKMASDLEVSHLRAIGKNWKYEIKLNEGKLWPSQAEFEEAWKKAIDFVDKDFPYEWKKLSKKVDESLKSEYYFRRVMAKVGQSLGDRVYYWETPR